jgi:hypothetical protein
LDMARLLVSILLSGLEKSIPDALIRKGILNESA